jgi:hypothetical protein
VNVSELLPSAYISSSLVKSNFYFLLYVFLQISPLLCSHLFAAIMCCLNSIASKMVKINILNAVIDYSLKQHGTFC